MNHVKKLILLLCIGGISLNAWLSWQKLTGRIDSIVGCGKAEGCANALGSHWSLLFGIIPVSILAIIIYLLVIIAIRRKSAAFVYIQLFLAWLLIGSVVWFSGIQLFVLQSLCKFCMLSHGIGLTISLLLFCYSASMWKKKRESLVLCMVSAFFCITIFAFIQIWGPKTETHLEREEEIVQSSDDIHTQGKGRLVDFFQGRKSYRISRLPHFGSSDAKFVIVKYYDYKCNSCRDVHGDLEKLLQDSTQSIAVILLPTPLNRKCNSYMADETLDHAEACELALYALSVWQISPTKFPEYHNWLFENPQISGGIAKLKAEELVGKGQFNKALESGWANKIITQNVLDYSQFIKHTIVMPKLLLGGSNMLHGVTKDYQTFQRAVEKAQK